MPPRPLLAVLALLCAAPPVAAQTAEPDTLPPQTEPVDVRLLRAVYNVEAGAFAAVMRGVNDAAYPVFAGTAPALALGTLAAGGDPDAAVRLAVAESGSIALTYALKRIVLRPRPYRALDDIAARDRQFLVDDVFDPHSFPSGHTSTAFAIATSLSLSYPEWYVVVPSLAWASAIGTARVWHGVHYPSDVLVGAGVGAGSAALVHLLLPSFFSDGDEGGAVVPFSVVVPL